MKTERLLSILMILLHRRKITASELAEYFEVSVRTIQRDMDSLAVAGIPLYANVGKDGGYQLMEDYRISGNFLSKDEMDTLVVVLRGFQDTLTNHAIRTIFEKLNGMRRHDSAFDKLVISLTPWGADSGFQEKLRLIETAIDRKEIIEFSYYDLYNRETRRTVEPYTLVLKLNTWYLFGYCLLRQDYRFFKLHRMFETVRLEEAFIPREDVPVQKPWDEIDYSRAGEVIVLRFSPAAKPRIPDLFDPRQWTIEEDGSIRVSCRFPIDEWVMSLLLSLGPDVEVLAPDHLRQEIIRRFQKSLRNYR